MRTLQAMQIPAIIKIFFPEQMLGHQKAKFLGLMITGLANALVFAAPSNAVTIQNGFAGDYAPTNWTFNGNGGDGSVNTTGAPSSISITGNDDGQLGIFTNYTTSATASGQVNFDWSWINSDIEVFGYLLNGTFNELSRPSRNGTTSFSVVSGDSFGFSINGEDGCCGTGTATISNFSAPSAAAVPAPLPILGLPAVLFYSRKLKKRIKASRELSSNALV
jgi:hypothetical protein